MDKRPHSMPRRTRTALYLWVAEKLVAGFHYPCVLKWPGETVVNSEFMEAKSKAKPFSYEPQICHN